MTSLRLSETEACLMLEAQETMFASQWRAEGLFEAHAEGTFM